ncbi:MAG: DNA methyltransferase [Bacilli bacterium]|jgi:hypothetical protein
MSVTEKQELKNVPLADLIPYARNPRKNDPAVQRIAASLTEYGLVKNSIVVDEDMVLITGHTTTKAMQALKWQTAPEVTQVFGLTKAQKKAYRIADNRLGELAEWDEELLALEIEDLKDLDFDPDLTGFDDAALAEAFPPGKKEITGDNYEPPAEIETDIRRGDIIQLGRHRLLCGDAQDKGEITRLLDGAAPDLLYYDPPYEDPALWECYVDAPKALAFSDARHIKDAMQIASRYSYIYEFIWDTVISWYLDNRPLCRHRSAFLCQNDPGYDSDAAVLNDGKPRKETPRVSNLGAYTYHPLPGGQVRLTTLYQKSKADLPAEHGKPVEWIAPIIAGTHADIVLDLFGGAGATIMACEQIGATCYTIEIDPGRCQAIKERYFATKEKV